MFCGGMHVYMFVIPCTDYIPLHHNIDLSGHLSFRLVLSPWCCTLVFVTKGGTKGRSPIYYGYKYHGNESCMSMKLTLKEVFSSES